MGYMGFGMRKEVYTRKPKAAFKKLKKIYGKHPNLPASNVPKAPSNSTSFEKHSYKPFFQTLPYLIFKRTLILFLLGTGIWFGCLDEPFLEYQRKRFEQNEIVNFYHTELQEYQRILSFLESRTDRIISIHFTGLYDSFDFRIRSTKLDTLNPYSMRYVSFEGIEERTRQLNHDEIVNGTITVERKGFLTKTYQNNWAYSLRSVVPNQVPSSMIDYLESDREELLQFFNDVKSINEWVNVEPDSISVHFHDPRFGRYTIVYSTQAPVPTSELKGGYYYNTLVGKLDNNVYWIRNEKVRGS